MSHGKVKGYFLFGQNPAAARRTPRSIAPALRNLDWLVVRDWFEIESAGFWYKGPEQARSARRDRRPRCSSCPPRRRRRRKGSFTNTQRLLQWHDKAVDPPGDCRSDAWFVYHLGKRLKAALRGSRRPTRSAALQNLTWDYDSDAPPCSPTARQPDRRRAGCGEGPEGDQRLHGRRPRSRFRGFSDLKDDGIDRVRLLDLQRRLPGARIATAPATRQRTPRQPTSTRTGASRGRTTGASCTTAPRPIPRASPGRSARSYIWWDAGEQKWTGLDEPDFEPDKPPDYRPGPDARGHGRDRRRRSVHHEAGRQGLAVRAGRHEGRPAADALRAGRIARAQPALPASRTIRPSRRFDDATERVRPTPLDPAYPIVATHVPADRALPERADEPVQLAGSTSCSRRCSSRSVPSSRRSAASRTADWMVVSNARGPIEARAMVTRRMRPLADRRPDACTRSGMPFHWGFAGETVGAIANDLTSLVADPNVSMHEGKAFTCDVTGGPAATTSRRDRAVRRRRGRHANLPPTRRVRPAGGTARDEHRRSCELAQRLPRARRTRPRRTRRRASSPTPRCASAARRARSPASSGTSCPPTASTSPATATTTRQPLGDHLAARRVRGADRATRRPAAAAG